MSRILGWKNIATATLFLLLAAVFLLPLGPVARASGSIMISPSSGHPGAKLTVSGSGFPASSTINVVVRTADAYCLVYGSQIGTGTSDLGGSFTISATMPADLPAGDHEVVAETQDAMGMACATFTITPYIVLSPTSSPKGNMVEVTGHGFDASATYQIQWVGGVLTSASASASGNMGQTGFHVPTNMPPGQRAITVQEICCGFLSASALLTVTTPSISLSPPSGPPGTPVTVTGSGFTNIGAQYTVTYFGNTYNCPSSCIDSSGVMTAFGFMVPDDASLGSYPIVVTDSSTNKAMQTFTVTNPITTSSTSVTTTSTSTATSTTTTTTSTGQSTSASTTSTSTSPISSTTSTVISTVVSTVYVTSSLVTSSGSSYSTGATTSPLTSTSAPPTETVTTEAVATSQFPLGEAIIGLGIVIAGVVVGAAIFFRKR